MNQIQHINMVSKKISSIKRRIWNMPSVPKELKGIIPPRRKKNLPGRLKITQDNKDKIQKEFLKEYRKEGQTMNKAAKIVGFTRQHIYKWTESDPEFAAEFEELRYNKQKNKKESWNKKHEHDEEHKEKFLELYTDTSHSVVSALKEISPELTSKDLEYWQKTDIEFKKRYKALQRLTRPRLADKLEINKMVKSVKLAERQKKFLDVFRNNHFNVTNACKATNISRATLTDWCKKNPDFRSALDELQDEKEDYIEDKLFELVDDKNMVATIFASKVMLQKPNIGRRHAYIDQPQKVEGTIQHVHKFDQEQLDAVVRGVQIDRTKYNKILQLDDPTIIDAEYTDETD